MQNAAPPTSPPLFQFTGHPLVDVGVATLMALADVDRPEDLTPEHRDRIVEQLMTWYCVPGRVQNFLHGTVFPNAYYNASWKDPVASSRARADTVMRASAPPDGGYGLCQYCGRPAALLADRSHIPLLNGRDIYNFLPNGRAGFPVCASCLLAIQTLPVGSIISGGRLLLIVSSEHALTQKFARRAVAINLQSFALTDTKDKLPNYQFPKTRLVEALLQLADAGEKTTGDVTGYWVSNSGQSAKVAIYELGNEVVAFLAQVQRNQNAKRAWAELAEQGWETRKKKSAKSAEPDDDDDTTGAGDTRKNALYDDLFTLPEKATQFVARYLLPTVERPTTAKAKDGANAKTSVPKRALVLKQRWDLARIFARKVMGMQKEQIDAIRDLGDQFARYIIDYDKKSFLYDFARAKTYGALTAALVSAGADAYKRGFKLTSFNDFVAAFEAASIDGRNAWRGPRNLITIRILDKLAERQIEIDQNIDPEDSDSDNEGK